MGPSDRSHSEAIPAYLEVQLKKVRRQWHRHRFPVRLPFLHHLRPGLLSPGFAESDQLPFPPAKPVLSSEPCQAKYVHWQECEIKNHKEMQCLTSKDGTARVRAPVRHNRRSKA